MVAGVGRVLALVHVAVRVATAAFVDLGVEVRPSRYESDDLLVDIDRIHQQLYALDANDEKNGKRITELETKVQKVITDYTLSNSCLRYELKEYMTYDQYLKDNAQNDAVVNNNGMLISIGINFRDTEQYIDPSKQIVNVNIMDRYGNTLRRIGHIRDDVVKLLINYPVTGDVYDYNSEYFDLCFENMKYDKSWTSHVQPILAYVELSFGVDTIKNKYEESSSNIEKMVNKLDRVYNEVEIVTDQLLKHLDTSEVLLRDVNEDTLSKHLILFTLLFTLYLAVNFTQVYWLIRYLRGKNLV